MLRFIIILIAILNFILSNNDKNIELPIGMTDDEKLRIDEIFTMGRETDPPPIPIRNIAEYERMAGVLIRYPFGISTDIIAEISENVIIYCLVASSQQSSAISLMENNSVNMDNVEWILGETDSYWTRDYGPWWVVDGNRDISVVDFTYNRPRFNDNDAPLKLSNHLDVPYYASDIIHAGGNYMTDGMGIAASSDLVYDENNISQEDVHLIMENYYGISTYHVVDDPNNTYIDHIDCWGKYLSPTKVLIREVPDSHPQYDEIEEVAEYFSNTLNQWGEPWSLFRVWTPNNEPYTNSLLINEKVLVPITGGGHDDDALAQYELALPGYEVMGFTGSWESTDALHCRIKGIPDIQMLQVFHNPLNNGAEPNGSVYEFEVIVDDISQAGIIVDSMKVYWKTIASLNWSSDNLIKSDISEDNRWFGTIPALLDSGNIQYYIKTADSSGRVENNPMAGWHTFFAHPTEVCDAWSVGDVDNSGSLDIIDILFLSDFIMNNFSGICSNSVSDINNDNEITLLDLIFLVNIVVNS